MNSQVVHHSINASVATLPVASIWAHAPEDVSVAVGVMAFLYYLLFFVKEIIRWRIQWLEKKHPLLPIGEAEVMELSHAHTPHDPAPPTN